MSPKLKIFFFLLFLSLNIWAQAPQLVRINPQHYFQHTVPKGNYSGLTWLGGSYYAVVSDKTSQSGFFLFCIEIDYISGDIKNIEYEGFY